MYGILEEGEFGVWSGRRMTRELPASLEKGLVAIRSQVINKGEQIITYLQREADGSCAADSVVTG